MALPDVDDVKAYLRIQNTVEDDLLAQLLVVAFANVQAYLRVPVVAEERTHVFERPSDALYRTITVLHFPWYPITAATTITDVDGTVLVEDVDYRVERRTGAVYGIATSTMYPFGNWPLTMVAPIGLDGRDDYATAVEPVLFGAILDAVADRYQKRSPNATNESTGGGVSTSYGEYGLPMRVCDTLKPFQMVRAR